MSAAQARTAAYDAVTALRVDESNYVFILDTEGHLLSHPRIERGGEQARFHRSEGQRSVPGSDRAAQDGGGFVDDFWPRFNADYEAVPKTR